MKTSSLVVGSSGRRFCGITREREKEREREREREGGREGERGRERKSWNLNLT